MFSTSKFHKNEKGQAALETAIILIAFVVVASVFAFAILSAGSASTERGEQAIYSGLEGVQGSMEIRGAVIAQGASGAVTDVIFTVATVSGGNPINLAAAAGDRAVVIGYRDAAQLENNVDWTVDWIVAEATPDDLLEDGELAEITVDLSGLTTSLAVNTAFTLEVKPPTGGVLQINRTTPAAIETVMELR
ncbi:MAG: archaellin/type IV pilin N-terminal domain-containing protein [Chloroflexota bacterium]|nr:archaellin/type IV pilin N-terminal domain-containing protein [Chloroflexota bacterium]